MPMATRRRPRLGFTALWSALVPIVAGLLIGSPASAEVQRVKDRRAQMAGVEAPPDDGVTQPEPDTPLDKSKLSTSRSRASPSSPMA